MDWEIGHINISVQGEEEKAKALELMGEKARRDADEGIAGCPWEDDSPIVGWHTDSYPFVCVTMLSDCTNMVGGETALRKGNGEVVKVRGPQMVSQSWHATQRSIQVAKCPRVRRSSFRVVTLSTRLCVHWA
jgi:hypothetical protein